MLAGDGLPSPMLKKNDDAVMKQVATQHSGYRQLSFSAIDNADYKILISILN